MGGWRCFPFSFAVITDVENLTVIYKLLQTILHNFEFVALSFHFAKPLKEFSFPLCIVLKSRYRTCSNLR